MDAQDIRDNITARRNKIFLLMEEVRATPSQADCPAERRPVAAAAAGQLQHAHLCAALCRSTWHVLQQQQKQQKQQQ
jgi:hypothetical protein